MTDLAGDSRDRPIQVLSLGNTQVVAFTTATGNSNVFVSNVVRVVSTSDCHIASGNGIVATTSDALFIANVPEYLEIEGPTHRLSIIQNSAAGNVYITEMH